MRRPLKFLHLTTFYPPYSFGGDAMYVYRLAHALADAGHHVDVVHHVDAYHMFHPAAVEMNAPEHPNVKRHELRTRFGPLAPVLSQQTGHPLLILSQLRALLDRQSYDVIHYHTISLLGLNVLALGARQPRALALYTAHDYWGICPLHFLWKFRSRPCEKPECFRCTLQARRPPQLWRYTRLLPTAGRHVDRFLSPSQFTVDMHAQRGFPFPMHHLPYFVEDGRSSASQAARPHERPYFLFVGRLEMIKGLQTLIEIWDRVPQAELLVAGTGSFEGQLRAQAAGKPRIRFLGPQSQTELGPLYEHALACLVPSLYYETFGLVIIEALSRGTPVVVRDIGPMPEIVASSGGGFVYRTQDELVNELHQLAAQPELRRELGERGYRAFVREWSPRAHLQRYFQILDQTAIKKLGYLPWDVHEEPHKDSLAYGGAHVRN